VKQHTTGNEHEILCGSAQIVADTTTAIFAEVQSQLFCRGKKPENACRENVAMGFEVFDAAESLYGPSNGEFWQAASVFVRPRAASAIRQNGLGSAEHNGTRS
jgi:hypothetical protein